MTGTDWLLDDIGSDIDYDCHEDVLDIWNCWLSKQGDWATVG